MAIDVLTAPSGPEVQHDKPLGVQDYIVISTRLALWRPLTSICVVICCVVWAVIIVSEGVLSHCFCNSQLS